MRQFYTLVRQYYTLVRQYIEESTNIFTLRKVRDAWMSWIVFEAGRTKDALRMKAKQGIVSCDYKSAFLVRHGQGLCHCGN